MEPAKITPLDLGETLGKKKHSDREQVYSVSRQRYILVWAGHYSCPASRHVLGIDERASLGQRLDLV